jgi:hypothetical protein
MWVVESLNEVKDISSGLNPSAIPSTICPLPLELGYLYITNFALSLECLDTVR